MVAHLDLRVIFLTQRIKAILLTDEEMLPDIVGMNAEKPLQDSVIDERASMEVASEHQSRA